MLAFLGGAGIGIGSFAFHATLKYQAQLLDELPMIYTMAYVTPCEVCRRLFMLCLATQNLFVLRLGNYARIRQTSLPNPPSCSTSRPSHLCHRRLRACRDKAWADSVWLTNRFSRRQRTDLSRKSHLSSGRLWPHAGCGHAASHSAHAVQRGGSKQNATQANISPLPHRYSLVLGSFRCLEVRRRQGFPGTTMVTDTLCLASIDNIYCSHLRRRRQQVGYPWAILLEGHGWWHLGTGLGGYLFCTAVQRLMLSVKEGNGENFTFEWHLGFIPHVKRIQPFRTVKGEAASSKKGS